MKKEKKKKISVLTLGKAVLSYDHMLQKLQQEVLQIPVVVLKGRLGKSLIQSPVLCLRKFQSQNP